MIIKSPDLQEEFDQIHELNYKTFVEEIPQHVARVDKKLVDKFHYKNNYLIAKNSSKIIGMVSYNSTRPFSLDLKIDNLDSYLPEGHKVVEVRLLSVVKSARNGIVMYHLVKELIELLVSQGFNLAVISGTTRELKLYQKIGFIPFGPLVGKDDAMYQPMFVTLGNLKQELKPSKA